MRDDYFGFNAEFVKNGIDEIQTEFVPVAVYIAIDLLLVGDFL